MRKYEKWENCDEYQAYITNSYNGLPDIDKHKKAKTKLPTDKYGKGSKWTKPKKRKRR